MNITMTTSKLTFLGENGPGPSYATLQAKPKKTQELSINIPANSTTPSLAVVSVCIPGDRFSQDYINLSHNNKRHYCQRYNATCILPTEQVSENSKTKKHKKWDKLYHIEKTLRTTNVEWVLWMDCDTAFTNFDIHWYLHLEKHLNRSKLMVASEDQGGINLGVFLVPNTVEARSFISNLYDLRHIIEAKKLFHKDQSALKTVLTQQPQLKSKIEIVDQKLLNTYLDNNAGKLWSPSDFIVHQVFCLDFVACSSNFTKLVKNITPPSSTGLKQIKS
eukprot:CCRYP_009879-RA/>CCRYP_009879-RA protein AED:0.34 eAED:0.34 QI:0/-1/0/1/-1/1/1/0/275